MINWEVSLFVVFEFELVGTNPPENKFDLIAFKSGCGPMDKIIFSNAETSTLIEFGFEVNMLEFDETSAIIEFGFEVEILEELFKLLSSIRSR